jgi:hypothetical protein
LECPSIKTAIGLQVPRKDAKHAKTIFKFGNTLRASQLGERQYFSLLELELSRELKKEKPADF